MSEACSPFAGLARALDSAGEAQPRLVVSLPALDRNLERLRALPLAGALRLVVKSLPSLPLLRYVMTTLSCDRLMSFHTPFLDTLLHEELGSDLLLGKPLPLRAVQRLLASHDQARIDRVQWLVDSPERLDSYLAAARESGRRLRLAVEIDIGMHRGGLNRPRDLAALAATIAAAGKHARLSGIMGYDAHAAKVPGGRVAAAVAAANARYRAFVDALPAGLTSAGALTLNGAGSPTHTLHRRGNSPLNDISLGSVLLKPADFDLPQLATYEPAAWIATPLLKRLHGVSLPFLGPLSRALSRLPTRRRDTLFLYGGRWLAEPAWPKAMRRSALYGDSSNQQLMTIPATSALAVDDWVFFRPTQSEAVLLQFGDLRAVNASGQVEYWPVLAND